MIKYYCDRCEKECATLNAIKIPAEKTAFGFNTKPAHVCGDCEKEYNDINRKLTDIRFVLFADFMKGSE